MKHAVRGLVTVFALLVVVGYSSGVVGAGDETRLRAILTATALDPESFGHADFIQRPDRIRFSAEADNVEEIGTATVKVIRNPVQVTELRGQLFLESGEDPSPLGGPFTVAEARWLLGEQLAVQLENVDRTRFPGNEVCETRVRVGPVDESLVMVDGMAKLDIRTNVPDIVPGTGAEVRIRCEFQDGDGQRQRHETRWKGTLQAVASTSGVILEAPIEIVLDPLSGTGAGDLNLDSRLGDNVPVMQAEDTVEVWNADGQLILVGTLRAN